MVLDADRIIVCWAMGLTQHRNSVPTIREIVNFLLLRGNVGRPGAGVCPVRGHSNVQGDRTMGIYEKPKAPFLDALRDEFAFEPPRDPGYAVVDAIRAMRDGEVDVFFGLGGNFVAAAPDTAVTSAAMARCRLTAQVSTKLNRSHTVVGDTALILPCLGRTERDVQAGGEQYVTVEDSMSMVHASRGFVKPPSDNVRSEPWTVAQIAREDGGDFATGTVQSTDLIIAAVPTDASKTVVLLTNPGTSRAVVQIEAVSEAGRYALPGFESVTLDAQRTTAAPTSTRASRCQPAGCAGCSFCANTRASRNGSTRRACK